jgi:hypothetical protein
VPFGAPHLLLEMDVRCARYGAFEETFSNATLVYGCRGTTGSLPAALRDSGGVG